MSSRRIEDLHLTLLDKLISDSGLECLKSAPESLESSVLSGESEEQGHAEEEEEAALEARQEEEQKPESVTEISEELPYVFPTPSLRRVLPDKARKIEQQDRIRVLPEKFKTVIDPLAIPKIAYTAQQKYIEILGEIVGCKDYTSSLAEYWFLDTLANLLWRAQDDDLDRSTQAILIQWFCEWMKEMQHFDAADRERMMRRFEENMMSAAYVIAEAQFLPTPQDCGVYYQAQEDDAGFPLSTSGAKSKMSMGAKSISTQPKSKTSMDPKAKISTMQVDPGSPVRNTNIAETTKQLVSFERGAEYECALRDLTKIIHYIFDFPEYVRIDAPFQMQNPRRLYAPLKIKPKKEGKSPKDKADPKVKKSKKPEVLTEEYIELMQLRQRDIKQHELEQEEDREAYNRRSHILPLVQAIDEDFLDKYWPPPPPPPEPEMEPEPQRKGKKKK